MNSTEIERQKYAQLFTQVEALEEQVTTLEQSHAFAQNSSQPHYLSVVEAELKAVQIQLAEARTELARISNGCGKPRG